MLYRKLISASTIIYLIVASLGVLPYSLYVSGFERFAPKAVSYELAALALLLLVAMPLIKYIRWRKVLVVFFGVLILFVSFNLLIIVTEARPSVGLNIFLGIAASFIAGSLVSSIYNSHETLLKYWPPLTAAIIFIVLAWLFLHDGISYPQGILKPLLTGGIVSTELSNIAAIAFIAMLYRRRSISLFDYIILFALIALQFWFLATGTLIALLIVYLCISALEGKMAFKRWQIFSVFFKIGTFICLLYVVIMALLDAGEIKLSWLMRYSDDSYYGRLNIYNRLIETALNNSLTGIGIGEFYMPPHHNILGLAAQTGVVSAFIYTCFTFMALVYSFYMIKSRFLQHESDENGARIVVVLFGVAIFLWLKGFVHDTWQDKITYFCLGFIVSYNIGFFAKHSVSKIRKQITTSKYISR